jgi:uncharacterized membrane protein
MKNYIWNKIPIEYFFLVIGLFFGMKLVFINPPWQTNDEDRHFYNSWYYANGYFKPDSRDKGIGNPMPVKISELVQGFQGIRFNEKTKISKQTVEDLKDIIYTKTDTIFYSNPNYDTNPIGYIPNIIGVKLGEVYKKNPIIVQWWSRAFGLFAYLLIVFFAIRITPVYKNVLMLIALAPMSLYQSASVTYDTLCNATTFLIMAFIIKWLLQKEKVSTREIILFCVALAMQVFSKAGYYFIPFLVLIIPSEKFSFPYSKIKLAILLVAILMLPTFTWSVYMNSFHFQGGKPLQNDFLFSPSQNLAFHLKNIPGMISDLFSNVLIQGKNWIIGCIGRFGYSYTPLPDAWVFMYVIVLFGMASIDHNGNIKLTRMQRGISALLLLASLGAIITGLYLTITPVGARFIFGGQGRYFIPILPLLLFQLFGTIPNNAKKYLPLITILISILFLYKTVGVINETFYTAN